MEINLRKAITRTLTLSTVTVATKEDITSYTVIGETTPKKELKKFLKGDSEEIPTIEVETRTEKRAITLEKFLENSIIIESEEN